MSYDAIHPLDSSENGTCASLVRCLQMIERHAPRLMKQGGGGISSETKSHKVYTRVSEQTRDRIIEDYLANPVTLDELGAKYGLSDTFMGNLLNSRGISPRTVRRTEIVGQSVRNLDSTLKAQIAQRKATLPASVRERINQEHTA